MNPKGGFYAEYAAVKADHAAAASEDPARPSRACPLTRSRRWPAGWTTRSASRARRVGADLRRQRRVRAPRRAVGQADGSTRIGGRIGGGRGGAGQPAAPTWPWTARWATWVSRCALRPGRRRRLADHRQRRPGARRGPRRGARWCAWPIPTGSSRGRKRGGGVTLKAYDGVPDPALLSLTASSRRARSRSTSPRRSRSTKPPTHSA